MNKQELSRQIVNRHVLCGQNLIIEELIKSEKIDADCLRRNDNEEVLEWWLVTPWLAERLKEQGEIIIDKLGCRWWGRQTSGQAIYMDGVIQEICGED